MNKSQVKVIGELIANGHEKEAIELARKLGSSKTAIRERSHYDLLVEAMVDAAYEAAKMFNKYSDVDLDSRNINELEKVIYGAIHTFCQKKELI